MLQGVPKGMKVSIQQLLSMKRAAPIGQPLPMEGLSSHPAAAADGERYPPIEQLFYGSAVLPFVISTGA
jgi:hypothetical protein